MSLTLKLVGACALLFGGLMAGTIADLALNDGRILTSLMGRDGLEQACLPELAKGLASRGFDPNDIEFDARAGIDVALGQGRSVRAAFSFQDGAEATRVDGIMACVVGKADVRVEFQTTARPVRAT